MKYTQGQELREFIRLYKKVEEIYHNLALHAGLSDSVCAILFTLCEEGEGCSQKRICEQLSVSKQTLNSSIRKLKKEEYIKLCKGEKGRELQIYLTEKGKQLVREKIHPIMALEDRAFIRIPEKERAELLRLSRRYVEAMSAESELFLSSEGIQ